ncbi:MAG TPA: HAMP domain-containing sensor histidine kinase [Clostridia bacterium]|nr:HAMP domain-containing sensor histidine kinase [Clostridia bacterium]
MANLLLILERATQAAFLLLALAALIDWIRHRDRRRGQLALAFGSLAALIVIASTLGLAGAFNPVLTDVALVVFLLSGYALLMFRDSFIPLSSATRRAVPIAIAAVAVLGMVAQLQPDPQQRHGPLQAVALIAVMVTWSLCVLEPIVRLWLSSINRPSVESARLRALSFGYAALAAEVIVGTLAGSAVRQPNFALATAVVTLAIVPLLVVSFSPPAWLRWLWRQPEEDAFRNALHDLLLFSPDRGVLADRALGWAMRLVGGAGAFIVDSDGSILAAQMMTLEEAQSVAAGSAVAPPKVLDRVSSRAVSRLTVPLHLQKGEGAMIILSGAFTPMFGDDEVLRLQQYAGSITAGLDRVLLNERVASLEKVKTEFLNVASHELRGPMTVIKGYLTMLEAGSIGDLSAQTRSVLNLLITKSDEVTWMLDQMVEVARLEEGRLALHKLPSDLVQLTELAVEGVSQLLSKHVLSVETPPRPIQADVDPDRFQIVVRNLLSNAAKYSPEGARIGVRVSSNGVAKVAVTDEGFGIAFEDQARLFTRFARIETKATVGIAGTGLGLWLSREIARMHDGDLTVESTAGRGSTFTFQVPLNR